MRDELRLLEPRASETDASVERPDWRLDARDRRHVALFLGSRVETRETIRLPGLLGVLPICIHAKQAEMHVALNGSRVAVLAKNDIV